MVSDILMVIVTVHWSFQITAQEPNWMKLYKWIQIRKTTLKYDLLEIYLQAL